MAAVMLGLLTAACAGDSTAPQLPEAAPSLTPMVLDARAQPRFVTATVRVVDVWGSNILEKPTVKFTSGGKSVEIKDNSNKDLDPALGVVKALITPDKGYEVCAVGLTPHYIPVPYNELYPICRSVRSAAEEIDLGSVYMRRRPQVTFTTMNVAGDIIVGASYQVTQASWTKVITDGVGEWDADLAKNGHLTLILQADHPLEYCEITAPNGYALPDPACGTVPMQYDVQYGVPLYHERLAAKPGPQR